MLRRKGRKTLGWVLERVGPKTQALTRFACSLAPARDPDGFRATRLVQKKGAEISGGHHHESNDHEKAMHGINNFLERRGYEIIGTGWAHGKDKIDSVARNDDTLVFIDGIVRANEGNGMDREKPNRDRFEHIAAAYPVEHLDITDSAVRFDPSQCRARTRARP